MAEYPSQDPNSYYTPVGSSGTDYTPETNNWGGGGWDGTSIVNTAIGSLGSIFGGIAGIIGATQGNTPVIIANPNGGYTLQQPGTGNQPAPQQPANNTVWIIIAIAVVLLLVIGGAYFFTR